MGNQAAGAVSSEDEATRGCQYTAATAAVRGFIAMSPFRFARLIVDRCQIVSSGAYVGLFSSANSSAAARIDVSEIEDRIGVFFRDIQKSSRRGEGGRLPIDGA